LLQAVAARIIERYLLEGGATGVMLVDGAADPLRLPGVDLVCNRGGSSTKIKVKADAYYGADPRKVADQGLVFYRAPVHCYAFETISHHLTRDPGWMVASSADELYYYRLALAQTEEEIAALMNEADAVFFSELWVDRDELVVLPMHETRTWFVANAEKYQARPVITGGVSSWNRLIPRADIDTAVAGLNNVGSIFRSLHP